MSKGIGMPLIGLEQVSKEALAENCKAAQEQLKQAREEIASMNDSNFKLYNQTEEQFKIIQDQKKENGKCLRRSWRSVKSREINN